MISLICHDFIRQQFFLQHWERFQTSADGTAEE
jgi:hypothetical protein